MAVRHQALDQDEAADGRAVGRDSLRARGREARDRHCFTEREIGYVGVSNG